MNESSSQSASPLEPTSDTGEVVSAGRLAGLARRLSELSEEAGASPVAREPANPIGWHSDDYDPANPLADRPPWDRFELHIDKVVVTINEHLQHEMPAELLGGHPLVRFFVRIRPSLWLPLARTEQRELLRELIRVADWTTRELAIGAAAGVHLVQNVNARSPWFQPGSRRFDSSRRRPILSFDEPFSRVDQPQRHPPRLRHILGHFVPYFAWSTAWTGIAASSLLIRSLLLFAMLAAVVGLSVLGILGVVDLVRNFSQIGVDHTAIWLGCVLLVLGGVVTLLADVPGAAGERDRYRCADLPGAALRFLAIQLHSQPWQRRVLEGDKAWRASMRGTPAGDAETQLREYLCIRAALWFTLLLLGGGLLVAVPLYSDPRLGSPDGLVSTVIRFAVGYTIVVGLALFAARKVAVARKRCLELRAGPLDRLAFHIGILRGLEDNSEHRQQR